jgi:hypothetical protein
MREKRTDCTEPGCKEIGYDRYSMGIYATRKCDPHWEASGYNKGGREAFDPSYAGERYDDDY